MVTSAPQVITARDKLPVLKFAPSAPTSPTKVSQHALLAQRVSFVTRQTCKLLTIAPSVITVQQDQAWPLNALQELTMIELTLVLHLIARHAPSVNTVRLELLLLRLPLTVWKLSSAHTALVSVAATPIPTNSESLLLVCAHPATYAQSVQLLLFLAQWVPLQQMQALLHVIPALEATIVTRSACPRSPRPRNVTVVTTAPPGLTSLTQLVTQLAKVTFARRDTTAHLDLLFRLSALQAHTSAGLALMNAKNAQSATTVRLDASPPLSARTVTALRAQVRQLCVTPVLTALKLSRSSRSRLTALTAPTVTTAQVVFKLVLVMLVTSVTTVQLLTKTRTRFARPVITALLVHPCPSGALRLCTMLALVLLMFLSVSLAKLVTTAWITIVCLVCALRVISVRKRPRSLSHASKAPSTLTRNKSIRTTVNCAQLVLLATKRVLMTGLDTCAQLVITAHALA